MTKAKISEYDAVAANNTDVNGVNIAENCPPSGMNNMGREIMAALKRFQTGADGDSVTVGGSLVVSNTLTAGPVSATTLNTSGAVVFNDAGADVDFRVEGDTEANLLFVDAGNDRVGVGTGTPTSQVTLKKTNAGGVGSELRLINSSTTVESATQIVFTNTTSDSGNSAVIQVARTSAGQDFRFSSDGSERMRIDSSGNVLIGTTSASVANAGANNLVVGSGVGSEGFTIYSGNAANCNLVFADTDNDFVGAIQYEHDNNAMTFRTNGGERMRITSGGEVYIAGTTDRGAYNLQCNGTGVWGAGAYVNASDERLKDNITSIDSGLDVVTAMRPVTFTYKEDYSKDQSIQTGFIAQELQQAMSGKNYVDGIVQAGPEYLNVAYQNLIPILTKAIQELKAELDTVKAELATLKGQ